jgi:hypothetical protein
MRSYPMKWVYMTVIVFWGILSFILMCGEDTPDNPMTMLEFFELKVLAVVSFGLCLLTARWLDRKGLLPDMKEED